MKLLLLSLCLKFSIFRLLDIEQSQRTVTRQRNSKASSILYCSKFILTFRSPLSRLVLRCLRVCLHCHPTPPPNPCLSRTHSRTYLRAYTVIYYLSCSRSSGQGK